MHRVVTAHGKLDGIQGTNLHATAAPPAAALVDDGLFAVHMDGVYETDVADAQLAAFAGLVDEDGNARHPGDFAGAQKASPGL